MFKSESEHSVLTNSTNTAGSTITSNTSKTNENASNEKTKPVGEPSAFDLEIRLRYEKLLAVMDDLIIKSKLAAYLPELTKEGTELKEVMSQRDLNFVTNLYETYQNGTRIYNISTGGMINSRMYSLDFGRIMYTLLRYKELKKASQEYVNKCKLSRQCDSGIMFYVLTMENIREELKHLFEVTAEEDFGRQFLIKSLINSTERYKAEIKAIRKTIIKEHNDFEKSSNEKVKKIEELFDKLQKLEMESNRNVNRIILDSERKMVLSSRAHLPRMEVLHESIASWTDVNSRTLENHLKEEKALRVRRTKAITQVKSWEQKYSQAMEEKQQELDEFQELLKAETALVRELEAKLEEQQPTYDILMAERDQEYTEELERKMTTFLREHSARVLQNYWRLALEIRAKKERMERQAKKEKSRRKS